MTCVKCPDGTWVCDSGGPPGENLCDEAAHLPPDWDCIRYEEYAAGSYLVWVKPGGGGGDSCSVWIHPSQPPAGPGNWQVAGQIDLAADGCYQVCCRPGTKSGGKVKVELTDPSNCS